MSGELTGSSKDDGATVMRYCEIDQDTVPVYRAKAGSVVFFVHDVDGDPHSTQGWKVEKVNGTWVLCSVSGPVVLADLYEP